jgi:Polyprenyl synthetase
MLSNVAANANRCHAAAPARGPVDDVRALLSEAAQSRPQAELLLRATRLLEHRLGLPVPCPSVVLPRLVYQAVTGKDADDAIEGARPAVTVASLLETGIDLLDHLQDDELDSSWGPHAAAVVPMVSLCLLGPAAQLAVTQLPVSAARRDRVQALVANQLLAIAAGQQLDVGTRSATPSVATIERCVLGKTGERRALYARLGAELAEAPEAVAEAAAEMARSFGMARQISSDLRDVLSTDSRDLRSGTITWPLAWCLERAGTVERARWRDMLRRAKSDASARNRVPQALCDAGAVRRTAIEVERYVGRSLTAARSFAGATRAWPAIEAMLRQPSFAATPHH